MNYPAESTKQAMIRPAKDMTNAELIAEVESLRVFAGRLDKQLKLAIDAVAASNVHNTDIVRAFFRNMHADALNAGWWTDLATGESLVDTGTYNVAEKLCLIHSEISEAMEGYRKDLFDDKLPHRKMVEVELADAVIRSADLCGAMGLDLTGAILEKMEYNRNRSDHRPENRAKDGGKKF